MEEDPRLAVAKFSGEIKGLEATLKSAHKRIDKMEILIREDFKEIKSALESINGFMNRGKGWAAAGLLLAGMVGGFVSKFIGVLFSAK